MEHIVKRQGHKEKFDERKVYASCYAALLSAQLHHVEAEKVCNNISKDVKKWIKTKKAVTSDDIFKETTKIIRKYHKEAAFMYETHRDIS